MHRRTTGEPGSRAAHSEEEEEKELFYFFPFNSFFHWCRLFFYRFDYVCVVNGLGLAQN